MSKPHFEYASFWIRVGASLIDSLLIFVITFPLLLSFYGWNYFTSSTGIAGLADVIISWIFPIVAVVWFWTQKGATPGKSLLSLSIKDADTGKNLTIGQSIKRYLGYFVATVPLGIGLLWVALDRRKQGWHDKLANSVVVRAKKRATEFPDFPQD